MKLKLLIISALLSVCASCKAQSAAPVIKILNGTNFKKSEAIKYQVTSSQVVYYYIGLEQFLDNQWREIVLDISAGAPDRAAIVKKATEAKPFSGVYVIAKIPAMYLKNGKIFRLKMNYGINASSINQKVITSQVKVE